MSNWSGYSANNGLCDAKVHTNYGVLGVTLWVIIPALMQVSRWT